MVAQAKPKAKNGKRKEISKSNGSENEEPSKKEEVCHAKKSKRWTSQRPRVKNVENWVTSRVNARRQRRYTTVT